jgi:hypothetical protein
MPDGLDNGQVETKHVTIKTALKANKIMTSVLEIYPASYITTIKTVTRAPIWRSIAPILFFITHVFLI